MHSGAPTSSQPAGGKKVTIRAGNRVRTDDLLITNQLLGRYAGFVEVTQKSQEISSGRLPEVEEPAVAAPSPS
jgi:hypothetical protein